MKVIVSESLGAGYTANIISSCNDAGVQAIADYNGNEILFYDPANRLFARHSDIIKNMDIEIFDMFRDRKQNEDDDKVGLELRKEVMKPTEGKDFEDFATEWDALQKQESPDILKTKNCSVIRFGAHESGWKPLDGKDEVSEGLDDPRDWSASEGEVEIMWTVDYPEFGIESGNTESFVVDYDDVVDNEFDIEDNGLREEICRLIGKEYPDLDFEPYDFDILNEREFWGDEASRHIYPYDESDGEFETMADIDDEQIWSDVGIDDNDNVVEGIPNWATSYIMYGDDSGLTQEDVAMVDKFVKDLEKDGLRLSHPISGSENEFNSYPAFGDACDTVDWSCEVDGKSMNESESTGKTIDVTLKFTHSHYGKELKPGDERTIKVDLSEIPEIYDEDDLMSWLADIATEQIPGKGSFTKYDFEIEDLDSLIKAVKGDEGFGPDVDIDMDNFGPDSIPDNVSYEDAMKIYRKMRDAYDDRKLQYKDFDVARNKLMDSVVKGLLKEKSIEELADKWFIDYGTANGWGWKTAFKYNVANRLHEIHKKKHPEQHEPLPQREHWSGWHEDNCSCGFCSSSDSSD